MKKALVIVSAALVSAVAFAGSINSEVTASAPVAASAASAASGTFSGN